MTPPAPKSQSPSGPAKNLGGQNDTIRETIIALVISLAMALVVKTYVIEAYRIPTGSMAPTLMGDHYQLIGPETGHRWPVEGSGRQTVAGSTLIDPMTGDVPEATPLLRSQPQPLLRPSKIAKRRLPDGRVVEAQIPRAGDRILVQKYLYMIREPRRYDVAVFNNPTESAQQYIKRLVALPNEYLWLVDGDVFTAPAPEGVPTLEDPATQADWTIQPKPFKVQRSLWRTLFSSEEAPLRTVTAGPDWFTAPWEAGNALEWEIGNNRVYRNETPGAVLRWAADVRPVTDWEPYNDLPSGFMPRTHYPVGDVRMRAGIDALGEGLRVLATMTVRGVELQAVLDDAGARIQMREVAAAGEVAGEWRELGTGKFKGFTPGAVRNVEFWNYDQRLELVVDGKRLITADLGWGPSERLEASTGKPMSFFRDGENGLTNDAITRSSNYRPSSPGVEWEFLNAGVELHRVGLDRDIYYRPGVVPQGGSGSIGRACHPDKVLRLGPDHFFPLGDNSARSADARSWVYPDPWVASQIDDTPGVVHRDLLLGKAFFVYFPSPHRVGSVPMPDFGRMRRIR